MQVSGFVAGECSRVRTVAHLMLRICQCMETHVLGDEAFATNDTRAALLAHNLCLTPHNPPSAHSKASARQLHDAVQCKCQCMNGKNELKMLQS